MLEEVKEKLENEAYSCIVLKDGEVKQTAMGKGILPLLRIHIDHLEDLEGSIVGDKVIGKAAAMILLCSKVRGVYAKMISKDALKRLEVENIKVGYKTLVEEIRNASDTDCCPMEKLMRGVENAEEGVAKLKQFFEGKMG